MSVKKLRRVCDTIYFRSFYLYLQTQFNNIVSKIKILKIFLIELCK